MTLSLNDRATALADAFAADGDALGVRVATLANGARVIDCGIEARGGLEAGRRLAEICMAGLCSLGFVPLTLGGRWLPGIIVSTDHPALSCLGSQYAGWRLDRDGYFAMASGPGRALIRAEPLYDGLDVRERAEAAVLCLETRVAPTPEVADYAAARAGVEPAALTLLVAPTASLAGGVQIAARVVETAMHKLHELGFDVRRVLSAVGTCPLPPVAATDVEAIGRTNDAVLYAGQVHLTVEAGDDELAQLTPKVPSSASPDHGEPFGAVLERAGFDFYALDPMLFSPAEVRLTSVSTGRSFAAGVPDLGVLERSFWP
ncbi:MAG TPA: methenyltetrahydromethanopterin cyclohydrolase [Conexibacter sp.]